MPIQLYINAKNSEFSLLISFIIQFTMCNTDSRDRRICIFLTCMQGTTCKTNDKNLPDGSSGPERQHLTFRNDHDTLNETCQVQKPYAGSRQDELYTYKANVHCANLKETHVSYVNILCYV